MDTMGMDTMGMDTTAREGHSTVELVRTTIDVVETQIDELLKVTPQLNPNAVYTVWIGANDLLQNLQAASMGLITSADALHSRAYGIAVAKHGLFGDDSLGFAVTRPIQIYSGVANLTAADGVDDEGNLIIGHERLSLGTSTPETEMGFLSKPRVSL